LAPRRAALRAESSLTTVTRQEETERLRRLPEATMQEFHDAGILRVIQPATFGGFEADFICQIDLTYEIARSCGASGWVYAVLSAHGAMIANFSERAQQEVWGDDPCALASSSLSSIGRFKRVEGGYLVSGFWRYSSGYDYCAYLVAGADAAEPDETDRRSRRRFLLPIPALEIVDDWQVLGLAGTGSKSLRGEDVFAPERRSITDREFLSNAGPGRSLHDHCHLYRLSRYAHPGPLSLAMAGVGIAQHAVDYCSAHVDRMGVGRTSAVEREAIRHDIAEATTEVDAARLLIRRTVSEIERAGKARMEPVPRALVELVARDRHFATLYALRATDRLFRAAGSQEPGVLVRWLRATDLPLPPTVKRRSAARPPPMARPRSEAQRGSMAYPPSTAAARHFTARMAAAGLAAR
jgi:alkylation response protein AidB-like acyl-CoA dehydrogenase